MGQIRKLLSIENLILVMNEITKGIVKLTRFKAMTRPAGGRPRLV